MQTNTTQKAAKTIINQTLDHIMQDNRRLMNMAQDDPEYDKQTMLYYKNMAPKVKMISDICAGYEQSHPACESSFADTLVTSETMANTDVKMKCQRDSILIFTPIPPKTEKPFHGYDTALLGYAEEQTVPQLNKYCIHIVHCYSQQRAGGKIRDVDNNDTGFIHVLDQFFKPESRIEKFYEAWQPSNTFTEEGTYVYIASSFVFLHKPNALVRAVKGGLVYA